MAVDNRPFKSKEQDGQGNEVIIRDQQLVEQGTATTMASGACFETRDVDDRPVKIPRDNMMNIVLECIGIILNDNSRNLGTNVQKALGLQGNTVGHSTVADFASVLGVKSGTAWSSSDIPSFITAPLPDLTTPYFATQFGSDTYCIQTVANNSVVMQREIINGAVGSWNRCDNFGCATPSALAELLGVKFGEYCEIGAALNTLIDSGVYFVLSGSNGPEETINGVLIVLRTGLYNGNEKRVLQIYINVNYVEHHTIYYRVGSYNPNNEISISENTRWIELQ